MAIILLFAAPAFAQCNIGVAWAPDPIGAPTVTAQMVYHDTDGVDGGDTLVGTLGAAANVHQWSISQACYANDRVYIVTEYLGGMTVTSQKVAINTVVGAVLSNSIKHQE